MEKPSRLLGCTEREAALKGGPGALGTGRGGELPRLGGVWRLHEPQRFFKAK